MHSTNHFDVIIVGGSYAGLSAALTLGRSLRTVLVIDDEKPCNRPTPHAHNFLTRDGETPAQLTAFAKAQVLAYPTVTFVADQATGARRQAGGFLIETKRNQSFTGRKLLLATGLEDILPDLPGFAECWGRTVLHCPYCHGYEVRNQRLGILANGETAYDLVRLIQNWSKNLTLLTNGAASLTAEQRRIVTTLGVPIVETEVAELEHQAGTLRTIQFRDG